MGDAKLDRTADMERRLADAEQRATEAEKRRDIANRLEREAQADVAAIDEDRIKAVAERDSAIARAEQAKALADEEAASRMAAECDLQEAGISIDDGLREAIASLLRRVEQAEAGAAAMRGALERGESILRAGWGTRDSGEMYAEAWGCARYALSSPAGSALLDEVKRLRRNFQEASEYSRLLGAGTLFEGKSLADVAALQEAAAERDALLDEVRRLREAMTEAIDYMSANIPADGWGLCDSRTDNERLRVLEPCRAALEKKP